MWSTDWFYDPRRETAKLIAFIERRLEQRRAELSSEQGQEDREALPAFDNTETRSQEPAGLSPEQEQVEVEVAYTQTSDLFVEVGDRVTYVLGDSPSEKRTVQIIEGAKNEGAGIVNEQAPIALALIRLRQGEEGILQLKGQRDKTVRVIKIDRGQ